MKDSCYLISLDSKGKIRIFFVEYNWSEENRAYKITRYSGQYNGKKTQGPELLIEKGKANRTVLEQTQLQFNHLIKEKLDNGYNVILDRYVYSNMGHQGGKILDKDERFKMYEWLETLEFKLLELEVPDIRLFLHMPYDAALELRKGRLEEADQHEASKEHLINAENSYLEIAKKYNFKTIECVNENGIRSIDEINDEIYNFVKKKVR